MLKPPLGSLPNFGHPLTRGLVGLWLMNEGGGNIVQDLSGNGYIGTLNDVTWQAGLSGTTTLFPGVSGDYINIPCAAGSPADLTGQGTIVARIHLDTIGITQSVVGRNTNKMWLFINSSDQYLFRVSTGTTVLTSANNLAKVDWQTVAVTYDDISGDAHRFILLRRRTSGHGLQVLRVGRSDHPPIHCSLAQYVQRSEGPSRRECRHSVLRALHCNSCHVAGSS